MSAKKTYVTINNSPVKPLKELPAIIDELPKLGEDSEKFLKDIKKENVGENTVSQGEAN